MRAEKIEEMCWNGVDLPGHSDGEEGKEGGSSLSPEEDEYARQYADMLAAYKGQWTDIDLTGSLEPRKRLMTRFR